MKTERTFYHGTSEENWKLIQKEGILWGLSPYRDYRYTYLTPEYGIAKAYGDVILEVKYSPVGVNEENIDNYAFEHEIPSGMTCWQFSVFIPISISKIRRINV